jgi:hypothetical protein
MHWNNVVCSSGVALSPLALQSQMVLLYQSLMIDEYGALMEG